MIHWIEQLFIDSIHILFLLYLLFWSCFSEPKLAGFHHNYFGINEAYLSIDIERMMEEEGPKCFIVMAAKDPPVRD